MYFKKSFKKFLLPIIVILVGCIFSTILAVSAHTSISEELNLRFERDTDQVVSLIDKRMTLYSSVTYGTRALFEASDEVTANDWSTYANSLDLPMRFKGISSLIYIDRVFESDLDKLDFEIYPYTQKSEYYPIIYSFSASTTGQIDLLVPVINPSTLGFDISSETGREQTLIRARETGEISATPVVLSALSKVPVFSVYLPVYENGLPETQDSITGYVSTTFRVKELFEGLSRDPVFNQEIEVQIFDSLGTTLFDNSVNRSQGSELSSLSRKVSIDVDGQIWTMNFTALKSYSSDTNILIVPWSIFLVGSMFSALVGFIIYSYANSTRRAQLLAEGMTRELKNAKEKDEAILSSMGEGVAVANKEGKLVYWNKAAERIIGIDMSETPQDKWTDTYGVFYPDEKTPMPGEEQALAKAIAGQDIEPMEEFIRNSAIPNGKHILVTARPLNDFEGNLLGGVAVFRDMTKEREIDKAKSEFVSLASHQLRTPLTSINWYSELLLDEKTSKLNTEQKEYANEIHNASVRMSDLVNSLLNVSRLELGTFTILPKDANLLIVASTVIKEQQISIDQKKQKLFFEHSDNIPNLRIDPQLTHIILQNILSNASKYTPEGGTIELAIKLSEGEAEKSVVITCKDTGYGIPKDQQDNIFKKLFRADNVRTLSVEGTGLGLYIIKTIADQAGCSISFDSEENKGTTFVFKIPLSGMTERVGSKKLSSSMNR